MELLVRFKTPKSEVLPYLFNNSQNSQKKIDDKVKYCNAVFVRVGKAAVVAKREEALRDRKIAKQALLEFMT